MQGRRTRPTTARRSGCRARLAGRPGRATRRPRGPERAIVPSQHVGRSFDLRHTRHTALFGVNYAATSAVDLDARFVSSIRDGRQPWNASFAFNNAVELPQPIDQRTNDLSLGASWSNAKGMLRVGWDGSWFQQQQPGMSGITRFASRTSRTAAPSSTARPRAEQPLGPQRLQQRQRPGAGARGARAKQHDERGQRGGHARWRRGRH